MTAGGPILTWAARRTAEAAVLLAAVAFLSFLLGGLAPGDYYQSFRLESRVPADAIAAGRARHGLDRPLLARFGRWAVAAARGDLGASLEYEAPVAPLVLTRAARTLLLGLAGTGLAWLVALPLGVWMAVREGAWLDRVARLSLTAVLAVPDLALALGALTVAARTRLVPAGGMLSARAIATSGWPGFALTDLLRHLAMPAAVLALTLLPPLTRHVRSSLAEALKEPFITAARARGVSRSRVVLRSALRVAANPLVSLAGLSLAGLFSASLIIEVVAGWPGLGPLLVEATHSRDIPVVVGITLCSTALLAVGAILTDLGLLVVDPRLRASSFGRQ